MALQPGDRLGPYEIVSPIGAGGMGEVYKARDTRLGRTVAVKVLAGTFNDESARERFQQEARAASALNHPHIVAVFDVGEIDGRQYLVTEFVDGSTLREWAHATRRAAREIAELLAGPADGLAAAHEAGILHRDIKPENILVPASGYAKLADFGLAKLGASPDLSGVMTRAGTHPGVVVGTVAYMSPEQATGRQVDARSDIFSFGVVLYELLAGRRPFPGNSEYDVIRKVVDTEPEPLPADVPESMRSVVEKALDKNPSHRYQSARELAIDLRRLARPVTAPVTTAAGARISVGRWAGAAAALLVVGTAGAWGLWYLRQPIVTAAPMIRSLAVLPLQNLSGDPGQEYFSDGTTEELIAHLAQIRDVRVISRTSVAQYKGTTKDMKAIGRELGVDGIIEGSVRRSGGRVRVTAQLIHAATDTHVWAKDFDQDEADVLKLEANVAQAIADEIQVQLSPDLKARLARTPRVDPKAHDEALLGQYAYWTDKPERAVEHYEAAARIQLDYARAYAGISLAWQNLPTPEAVRKARQNAERALALDPSLAESHAAMGGVLAMEWRWTEADREFDRALELDPNSFDTCGCAAVTFAESGRDTRAEALADRLLQTNPLAPSSHFIAALVDYVGRRYERAAARSKHAMELGAVNSIIVLAQVYEAQGRAQDAVTLLERDGSKQLATLGRAYALAGNASAARDVLKKLLSPELSDRRGIAMIYFALGDRDLGFEWLNKSLDARDALSTFVLEPVFDDVRSDPRFQTILKRLNFPPPTS